MAHSASMKCEQNKSLTCETRVYNHVKH